MVITQNFKIAFRALLANKLRSALTMLGIIIGVGAVVGLMAIGNGAKNSITGQVQGAGSNLVTISAGNMQMGMRGGGSTSHLYYKDYELLYSYFSDKATFAPTVQSSYPVKVGNSTYNYSVVGVTREYFDISTYDFKSGRAINKSDADTAARVAVIGSQVSSDLFGGVNPVGRYIKINNIQYQVIGSLVSKGSSGFTNIDSSVIIPLETGYAKLFGNVGSSDGKKTLSSLSVSLHSPDQVDSFMTEAKYLLRRQHNLKSTDENDFMVMSSADMLSMLSTITDTLTIFLGAIAGISLLVGGIGIMNIMLVSVTERTREIGLRKAVGARKDQILTQFLVETLTISIIGGVIGVVFGWGIAEIVTLLNLITAQVTLSSIALALGFSIAIGLFFGIYPAYRAASLHPMEALRYE
jgi:putative ABC transport system permease protein